MVIEYKIKFEEDGVTITQSVNPGTATDQGGDGPVVPPDDHGGDGPVVPPDDHGGDGPVVPPDDHGGAGLGRGRLIAVVLGPLVIGNVGPARAATKRQRESVRNPAVAPSGTIRPRPKSSARAKPPA